MTAALVVHPDGEIVDVNLKSDADNHLALMRKHIGCRMVDVVALTSRIDMWLDDEGLHTQPANPVATALARHYGFTHQAYHGPVLLCGVTEDGESVDLDVDQLRALLTRLADVVETV